MAKIDFTKIKPTKKSELTIDNMVDYVKTKGKEDVKEFLKVLETNKIKKKNNLNGKEYEGHDVVKIREAFAEKYFPDLLKPKEPKNPPLSPEDKLKKFLEEEAE